MVAINKRFSVAASETGGALDVEVDVVANGGHAWIEVKHIAAGVELHSQDWVGNPGHLKGLFQQATELLRVAAAPCHQVRALREPSGESESERRLRCGSWRRRV